MTLPPEIFYREVLVDRVNKHHDLLIRIPDSEFQLMPLIAIADSYWIRMRSGSPGVGVPHGAGGTIVHMPMRTGPSVHETGI